MKKVIPLICLIFLVACNSKAVHDSYNFDLLGKWEIKDGKLINEAEKLEVIKGFRLTEKNTKIELSIYDIYDCLNNRFTPNEVVEKMNYDTIKHQDINFKYLKGYTYDKILVAGGFIGDFIVLSDHFIRSKYYYFPNEIYEISFYKNIIKNYEIEHYFPSYEFHTKKELQYLYFIPIYDVGIGEVFDGTKKQKIQMLRLNEFHIQNDHDYLDGIYLLVKKDKDS